MIPGAFRPQALVVSILSGILLTSSSGWAASLPRTNGTPKVEAAMIDADLDALGSRMGTAAGAGVGATTADLMNAEGISVAAHGLGMFVLQFLAPSADEQHEHLLDSAEHALSQVPENVLDTIAMLGETDPYAAWEALTKIAGPAVGVSVPSDWNAPENWVGLGLRDMEYAALGEAFGHVYGGKYASMPGYSAMGSYRERLKPRFNYESYMNMNSH